MLLLVGLVWPYQLTRFCLHWELGARESVGISRAGNGNGTKSLPVNTARPRLNTASATNGGQFEDGEYSAEVTATPTTEVTSGDRRGLKWQRS